MSRKSLGGIYLWICLPKASSRKILGCQDGGFRFARRLTACGGLWGPVLLLKLHLRHNYVPHVCVCVCGTVWKGQQSFVKMKDTISTRQSQTSEWDVLTGPWHQETQERDPQKPKALFQNRETTVGRELRKRHHLSFWWGRWDWEGRGED